MTLKEMIEERIAQLESDLTAEKAKLEQLATDIPAEFHSITAEVFAKIKPFFEGV